MWNQCNHPQPDSIREKWKYYNNPKAIPESELQVLQVSLILYCTVLYRSYTRPSYRNFRCHHYWNYCWCELLARSFVTDVIMYWKTFLRFFFFIMWTTTCLKKYWYFYFVWNLLYIYNFGGPFSWSLVGGRSTGKNHSKNFREYSPFFVVAA